MKKKLLLVQFYILSALGSFAQQEAPKPSTAYTKVVGYVSFLHPIVSIDKNSTTFNFSNSYTVGFPMGINILKSDKFGFTFEIAPFFRMQNDTSKISAILFHPGAMFRMKHGVSIVTRLAFETSGRYGLTPVLSKVMFKSKNVSYFTALGLAMRMGNERPFTFSPALQFGVTF